MATNLDQVRAEVRDRLAGRTRRAIARDAMAAKAAAAAQADLRDRHG